MHCITFSLRSIHTERIADSPSSKSTVLLEGWKLLFQNPSLRTVTYMDLIKKLSQEQYGLVLLRWHTLRLSFIRAKNGGDILIQVIMLAR